MSVNEDWGEELVESTNPAIRLHELLFELHRIGSTTRISFLDAWSEVLHVTGTQENPPDLRPVQNLYDEVLHVMTTSLAVQEEFYLPDAPDWLKVILLVAEPTWMNLYRDFVIPSSALRSLGQLGNLLAHVAPQDGVSVGDLNDIEMRVDELWNDVVHASSAVLGPDLRPVLLRLIADLRRVLEEYRIAGPDAFRATSYEVLGAVVFHPALHAAMQQARQQESEARPSIMARFGQLVGRLTEIVKVSTTAAQAIGGAIDEVRQLSN